MVGLVSLGAIVTIGGLAGFKRTRGTINGRDFIKSWFKETCGLVTEMGLVLAGFEDTRGPLTGVDLFEAGFEAKNRGTCW